MTRRGFIGTGIGGIACSVLGSPIRGVLGARERQYDNASVLPYDAEVEYLQSTGTQYIDTGVNADAMLDFRVVAKAVVDSTQRIAGALVTNPPYIRHHLAIPEFTNTAKLVAVGFGNDAYITTKNLDYSVHEFSLVSGVFYLDGVALKRFATTYFTCGLNWLLFGRNFDGIPQPAVAQIHKCQLTSLSVVIRDFIPVRFTNEYGIAEGAMYDTVSGKMFRNVGAGEFSFGGDI